MCLGVTGVNLPLVEQEPECNRNVATVWSAGLRKLKNMRSACVNMGCVACEGTWMEPNPVSSYFLLSSPTWSAPGLCSYFVRWLLVQVLGTFQDVQTKSSNLLLGFKVSMFGHISDVVCS